MKQEKSAIISKVVDMYSIMELVKRGQRRIPFEKMQRTINGYVWTCRDMDGLLIQGNVTVLYTEIKVYIDGQLEYSCSKDYEMIEKNLIPENEIAKIEQFRTKWKTSRTRNATGKCLYCGKTNVVGSMCENCRDKYQKSRKNVGGYPAYDPNASGSNSLKSDMG